MLEVLNDARESYDVVIVDSPPVLATADVEGIASHGGVQLLFVADRHSRGRSVLRAMKRLDLIEADIAGIVLNRDGQPEAYGY